MPKQLNYLQLLNTRYATILEELRNTDTNETTDKILELLALNQQIQTQIMIYLFTNQKELQHEIDTQLMEISGYLQEVVLSHIRESENLEKIR